MADMLDASRRVVSTTVARWQNLVEQVPADVLARRPAPGEWSALECLEHLLTVERMVIPVRVRHILEGREQLVPYDPDAPRQPHPETTARELLAGFAAERAANESLLARMEPADLERTSFHPEFGTVNLSMLVNLWAAHDLQHTAQAERALMQAFIPATGPWRYEFADEDVEVRAATA